MKYKSYWLLSGYLMFLLGITSVAMQMVGVYWAFLRPLELGGGLFAFLVKVLMIMGGIIMIVLARTDWEQEKKNLEE